MGVLGRADPGIRSWPDAPCAYLRFAPNPAYDAAADEARRRGWPYAELSGGHFHMLVDPTAVTEALLDLVRGLGYHELTTANPPVIDMAIPRDRWRPKVAYPPIHFYEFRPRLMALGLQRMRGPRGTELRVFDPERAVCDAFRLRRVVGSDLALEALRAYLGRRGRRHLNELLGMARETRVLRHIRPYVEALT